MSVSVAAVSGEIARRTTFGATTVRARRDGAHHARLDPACRRWRPRSSPPPSAAASRRPDSPSTPTPARCRSASRDPRRCRGSRRGSRRRRPAEAEAADVEAHPLGAELQPDLDRADVARLDDDVGERQRRRSWCMSSIVTRCRRTNHAGLVSISRVGGITPLRAPPHAVTTLNVEPGS